MRHIGYRSVSRRRGPLFVGVTVLVWLMLCPSWSWALGCFILSQDKSLYGTARWVKVNEKDTLLDIARDLGL